MSMASLKKMLKLDPDNQDIIDKINKERDAKKPKHKGMGGAYKRNASGGVIRLKSGGPVVDSYDYN
jgi:mRNA-degrading endonuclease RelE of RelBE toxin-antitoxin system